MSSGGAAVPVSRLLEEVATATPRSVRLRDAGTWFGGGTPSKLNSAYWRDGTIPWISPKDMGDFDIAETEDHITAAAIESSAANIVPRGSVAVVVRSSILDKRLPVGLLGAPMAVNQDLRALHPHEDLLDPVYLTHLLRSRGARILRSCRKTGGSVASIDSARLLDFEIQVPPLDLQYRVRNCLEQFRRLEAALEAELEARRRQYEFYRDREVDRLSGGPTTPFGELATIVRGASPRPIRNFITDDPDGVNWIKIGDVPAGGKFITSTEQRVTPAGAERSRRVNPGDFVLSNSMSFGRPYIVQIEGCIHDGWLAIKDFEDTFLPDFLYHLLRSKRMYSELAARASNGTVQNLNADIVKSLKMPAPSLEEQQAIVGLLDAFETIVNDLTSGLPAEIEARRTQYEFYRDRLLAFEPA